MPTCGIVTGERLGFITVGSAQKSFESPLLRPLTEPLNQLIEGTALAFDRGVKLLRGGVSGPLAGELVGRGGVKTFIKGGGDLPWEQQGQTGGAADGLEEVRGGM